MTAASDIVEEFEALLEEYRKAREASGNMEMWKVRLAAAVDRHAGPSSYYREQVREAFGSVPHKAAFEIAAAVEALAADYRANYLRRVAEVIHADVFEDFLDMASELARKHYHPSAAVLAGSVLEEHARKLAVRHGIALSDSKGRPRGFDVVVIDLVKTGVLTEARRKILAGWYGQRNEAAHGRHADVIPSEVERMIPGIHEFVANHPA